MDEPKVGTGAIPKGFSYVKFHTPFVERMRKIDADNRMKRGYRLRPYDYSKQLNPDGSRADVSYRGARRNAWNKQRREAKRSARAFAASAKKMAVASFVPE